MSKKITTKQLTTIALLIAMEIILTRVLSIRPTEQIRLSIGFLPIALIGIMYGPIFAGAAAIISDILGATLFPHAMFFPGFTLTAGMLGATYGILLHKKVNLLRIVIAALIVTVVIQLGIETLWLAILFGDGDSLFSMYYAMLPWRLVRTAIMFPVQVILIKLLVSNRVYETLQKLTH